MLRVCDTILDDDVVDATAAATLVDGMPSLEARRAIDGEAMALSEPARIAGDIMAPIYGLERRWTNREGEFREKSGGDGS